MSLHVGVLTTDYGAGATGAPGCGRSPGGQQGLLQARGEKAAGNCRNPVGGNFLSVALKADGTSTTNAPALQSPADTFACMASVGGAGCAFRHPLEALTAALTGMLPDNAGFLRDDAALAVMFLTDSDDCSAPPDSPLFDKNKSDLYGYPTTFRCRHFGVVCGDPPQSLSYGDSGVPAPALQGLRAPSRSAIQREPLPRLFHKPPSLGGLKKNPLDVILYAIDAPETPFQTILAKNGTPPYTICSHLDVMSNPPCLPTTQISCMNEKQPNFFGGPPVRLNAVVTSVPQHGLWSTCASDDGYVTALDRYADLIMNRLGDGCLPPGAIGTGDGGASFDCTVSDLSFAPDGTPTSTVIPACGGGTKPCWQAAPSLACAHKSPLGLELSVIRTAPVQPGTDTRATCVGAT